MSDFDMRNVGLGGVTGGAAGQPMDFAQIKQVLQRGRGHPCGTGTEGCVIAQGRLPEG